MKISRKKQAKNREILRQIRNDDESIVSNALLSFYSYDKIPIRPLISVLRKFENPKSRECAAYGLISLLLNLEVKVRGKCLFNRNYKRQNTVINVKKDIKFLIQTLLVTIEFDESEKVRGQALETLGMSFFARKNHYCLRKKIEQVVVKALSDESSEVRFWACYASGELKIKNALPKLQHLAKNDTKDWGQWWYISEEAEDAINWIYGKHTEARIPLSQRKKDKK